ncbi:capsid protein [Chicken smacovirus mg4_881]|uniref:Capsid protein n=1 Tax=Chicken smacovirus mg4_881 TaxID=2720958 RepID=A0A6G9W127_9VIRU|nr:capsid protein [Chicken smacovirus mg4_881]QIR82262.1 capsid protein [Chicken smacovirus mg4_881]
MVMVRISETYDLSTKVDKLGVVGIHTPTGDLIDRMYPGLVLQCRKFRFVKCDVAMACASMLPADPLQVGVEAGTIAPQDMFNPILYKAVSNDSMNNFLRFIQAVDDEAGVTASFRQGSIISVNNGTFDNIDGTAQDQFKMYYALLADSDGWRKAMPQSGLSMGGLYPLVYQVVAQFGNDTRNGSLASGGVNAPGLKNASGTPPVSGEGVAFIPDHHLRGPSMRMPSIDTMYYNDPDSSTSLVVPNQTALVKSNTRNVPPAYVGLIVLPPAKLNQLYYRLKVTWTIEFTDMVAMTDISKWANLTSIGTASYGSDYEVQSKAMADRTAMVDTSGADIEKVMESA